ncbi:MAG: GGDEF domain-containing protein [Acidobacteriota bacterium]|nr:GGDEF domain-containing protein [Acidobacteriota bacterium]
MGKHLDTRVTRVSRRALEIVHTENDCVVVIYTTQPTLLGKRFQLGNHRVYLGRDPETDVHLQDDSVSRKHAHFERRLDGWYVVDDGSTNGTYVNEQPIPGKRILANNDRIQIGSTILKYLSGADAEVQYHEEIYRVSILDGLTQIHNKRYFLEMLEREVTRSRRHDRPISLMMLDIDHFKECNDKFGHLAGDAVLRQLAELVGKRVRRDEVFARYGGEEFALLLPEAHLDGALNLAEILRKKTESNAFEFVGKEIRIAVSVGCAELGPDDETALDLIQRADKRLYEAKNSGRNRVCG